MIKTAEGVFLIDTLMSGRPGYTSVFYVRGKRGVLLDSGVSVTAENVIADLTASGVDLTSIDYIALTHAHYDHAGGARRLLQIFRERGNQTVRIACAEKPAVYISRADICEKLLRAGKITEGPLAGEMVPVSREDILVLSHGETIDLGGTSIAAVDSPGHANGHLVFHVPAASFVFTGDACGLLAKNSDGSPAILPTSFAPEYRHQNYLDTMSMIARLGARVIGFAHFGSVENGGEALSKAAETAERIRELAMRIASGALGRDIAIDELFRGFGPAFISLYRDPERVRLTLKSLIGGMISDVNRLA